MKLYGSNPQEIADASLKIGYVPSLNCNGITCCSDDGEHWATILFDYWTPNSVHVHIWIENAKALEGNVFMNEAWNYLRQNERTLAICITPCDNEASLKLQRALGFVEKYRVVDGWSIGVDQVVTEKRLTDG